VGGVAKKRKEAGEEKGAGKELKIVSVQVITPEKVMENDRQMALLYLIDKIGPVHEKTLHHIISTLKEEYGTDLGYQIRKIGKTPYSPNLRSDIIALLYVGFIEKEPTIYKRLRTTAKGKDALEQRKPPAIIVNVLEKNYEPIKNKASMLDSIENAEIRRLRRTLEEKRRRPLI
jgi:hypothetical protein